MYVYTYIYMCVCVYMYIYIYLYMHTPLDHCRPKGPEILGHFGHHSWQIQPGCEAHSYREAIEMGNTSMSKQDVNTLLCPELLIRLACLSYSHRWSRMFKVSLSIWLDVGRKFIQFNSGYSTNWNLSGKGSSMTFCGTTAATSLWLEDNSSASRRLLFFSVWKRHSFDANRRIWDDITWHLQHSAKFLQHVATHALPRTFYVCLWALAPSPVGWQVWLELAQCWGEFQQTIAAWFDGFSPKVFAYHCASEYHTITYE